MIGDGPRILDGSAEELSNRDACGIRPENGEAHDPAAEMIHDGTDPPAEGPALGERPGQPWHPESPASRDGCQVDVPDLTLPIAGQSTVSFLTM